MSDTVIHVENLSKRYRLGHHERYYALRDVLTRSISSPFRWLISHFSFPRSCVSRSHRFSDSPSLRITDSPENDTIWALKDVSFSVKRGEVVGIIGRNGAGKTTLLKILSRITEPTEGYAEIRGRVGSLLEVGTGFHPELTGRENIYLNGAILGMEKTEIDRKFDEIVAFAEVEKFIDTPVKYYSSGMHVRLAFAVAAHLEPEILLVDEVLAVGDAAFQKKCLGKMGDVAKEGRTVLFVSHNMGAIVTLCKRAILLYQGRVVANDSASIVTERYQSAYLVHCAEWHRPESMPSSNDFYFISSRARNSDGETCFVFAGDQTIFIEVEYMIKRHLSECQVIANFENSQGMVLFPTGDTDSLGLLGTAREPGKYHSEFVVPAHLLAPGLYTITLFATLLGHLMYDKVFRIITLEILTTGSVDPTSRRHRGVIAPLITWHTTREE